MNEDKAVRYHRLKRRAAAASLVAGAAVPAVLLATGGSAALRETASALSGSGASAPATVALYAIAFIGLREVVGLPLAIYSGFTLERRYGLSSESFRTWAGDHLKAFGLGSALALGGAVVLYALIPFWPAWWWVPAAGLWVAVTVLLAALFPVLLLPLFYRFTPLDRPALRDRLHALSSRAGVGVLGVFEWGLGLKTRRANAALVGAGRTRRILLSDTLLAGYSDDEIEVILAHELGHHVHRDIPKALAVESVLAVAAFGVAAAALGRWWASLGLEGAADVAGLPLLLLAGGAVRLAATPIVHAWSRRNEHRADRYAVSLTGQPAAFISAMRRLAAQNLAEPNPSRLAVWMFHSHPPVAERIARAEGAGS